MVEVVVVEVVEVVVEVVVGLSVRHGGGTGVVTLSILLSPHPVSLRPTPACRTPVDCNTVTTRVLELSHTLREQVMITLVPSDYAVMEDYKIIQAGQPLVITYLLSLNSRGLSPSLPPCLT